MNNPNPYQPPRQIGAAAQPSIFETNKVLRQTYQLLSVTLIFSALMAGLSMAINPPVMVSMGCSIGAIALLWFVIPRTANSVAGIGWVFAMTGLLGFGLGPILNAYISGFSNGGQIVMAALGTTGATFIGLSAYAIKSKKDFSFLGQFLFAGILIAFVASIGYAIASLGFGFNFQPLALGISAAFALLMVGLMLFETSRIVNGGETNYIMATTGLYVSIYNMFTSLLHLFGFGFGDD